MADKKFFTGSIKRMGGTAYGLVKNGKFTYDLAFWEKTSGSLIELRNQKLYHSGGYARVELINMIPAGSTLRVTFEVDTMNNNAGYADIYPVNSSGDSYSWNKKYLTAEDEIKPGVFLIDFEIDISQDTYKLNFNFNHQNACTTDNVGAFLV